MHMPETLNEVQRRSIRKIPLELRQPQKSYKRESKLPKRLWKRMREDSQFLRFLVQAAFALLCIWIGIEFHLFVKWAESGGNQPYVERPPGVEGFLPISALMSLRYWIETGVLNEIHPASVIILCAILFISFFFKKAFCSWLCPIGTLSETLWKFGKKLFGRTFYLPRVLDVVFRSFKYLLLAFFLYAIFTMDITNLRLFIYSPYNKVADVKMYLFFANISSFALGVILFLAVASLVVQNFWCRYLCPYGALLGIVSIFSPTKITRNSSSCIDCELCTKACPSRIRVHTATRVKSDECFACYACVDVCPVKNTLEVKSMTKTIPSWVFAVLIVGTFVAITGLAMLAGKWQNALSKEEYIRRVQNIHAPIYHHNRGSVPAYGPND